MKTDEVTQPKVLLFEGHPCEIPLSLVNDVITKQIITKEATDHHTPAHAQSAGLISSPNQPPSWLQTSVLSPEVCPEVEEGRGGVRLCTMYMYMYMYRLATCTMHTHG